MIDKDFECNRLITTLTFRERDQSTTGSRFALVKVRRGKRAKLTQLRGRLSQRLAKG